MGIAVGIWLHGEPLGLAFIEGDNMEGVEFEDHEYADVQTWCTNAESLADAVEEMALSN